MTLRMRSSLAAAILQAFSSALSPSNTSITADACASRTTAAAAAADSSSWAFCAEKAHVR